MKKVKQGISESAILRKIRLFHLIAGMKKEKQNFQEKLEDIELFPMNKLELDLIIYERNPFPEAAFLRFYPDHVEFLDTNEVRYPEGILFEGVVEQLEQADEQYFYIIKTKYGRIVAETQDEREIGEPVKLGIRDDRLYYYDIDENRLK